MRARTSPWPDPWFKPGRVARGRNGTTGPPNGVQPSWSGRRESNPRSQLASGSAGASSLIGINFRGAWRHCVTDATLPTPRDAAGIAPRCRARTGPVMDTIHDNTTCPGCDRVLHIGELAVWLGE